MWVMSTLLGGRSTHQKGVEVRDSGKVRCENVIVADSVRISEKKNPPIHKYPQCSEHFCGRGDVLRQVRDNILLCEGEETSLERMVAIIGCGGMGKSEIAKVLAKQLRSKYHYIFWFDAQTKESLECDLRVLAGNLGIPLAPEKTLDSVALSRIYYRLEENYRNGIFIFDNAEALKGKHGNFGLEEYLAADQQCKKPIFLVTSRNPWGSGCNKIKCVQLDRLSDEDSRDCLMKLLGVESCSIPESLTEATKSLVRMLEGHPLGLCLHGLTLAKKATDISLDTIESRVSSYIKLLKEQSLEEVLEISKYETQLQAIFDSALEKIEHTRGGDTATELLNIVALLSPDDIPAGLVNGIYCKKYFQKDATLFPRFIWDDLEITVNRGLKLLLSSSLLKIESKVYQTGDGHLCEYDMIKVHKVIQKSAQNRLLSGKNSDKPIEMIIRFNEQSYLDRGHIRFLLNFCLQNDWQTCYLQPLSMYLGNYDKDDSEMFQKVKRFLRDRNNPDRLTADSSITLCLLEILLEVSAEHGTQEEISRAKYGMLKLSPEFAKQYWVTLLCFKVSSFFGGSLCTVGKKDSNHADICTWLIQNYKDCKQSIPTSRSHGIIDTIAWICDEHHDWGKQGKFISKVFTDKSEINRCWWTFWKVMYSVLDGCNKETLEQLIPDLLGSSGTNIFSSSLQFSQDSFKYYCLQEWTNWFCACVLKVAEISALGTLLLGSKGFIESFWEITDFSLKHLASACTSNILTASSQDLREQNLCFLIGTWCFLFRHDVALYKLIGGKLDSEVADWLRKRRGSPRAHKWIDKAPAQWALLSKRHTQEFRNAEHCSDQTGHWIQELSKIL